MGADFSFATLPDFRLTDDRRNRITEFLTQLPDAAFASSFGDLEEFDEPTPTRKEVLKDVMAAAKRDGDSRDVVLLRLPGMDYLCRITGGIVYEGAPTDACALFDAAGRIPGLWNLFLSFAREDSAGSEPLAYSGDTLHFSCQTLPYFKLSPARRDMIETLVSQLNTPPAKVNFRTVLAAISTDVSRRDVAVLRLPGMNYECLVSAGPKYEGEMPSTACTQFAEVTAIPVLWDHMMAYANEGTKSHSEYRYGGKAEYIDWCFRGHTLDLSDLTDLSDLAADAIRWYPGNINLDGIQELSSSVAQRLAQHSGDQLIIGVVDLSDELAEALSQHRGDKLRFTGLTTLTETTASHLASYSGNWLIFSISDLSKPVADALGSFAGSIQLDGICEASLDVAKVLAQRTVGRVCLGLHELPVEIAKAFSTFSGEALVLDQLESLSEEAAQFLAKMPSRDLYLNALTELSTEVAAILVSRGGFLSLDGLTDFPDLLIEQFKAFKGRLDVCGLPDKKLKQVRKLLGQITINAGASDN